MSNQRGGSGDEEDPGGRSRQDRLDDRDLAGSSGDYAVTLVDRSSAHLDGAAAHAAVAPQVLDITDAVQLQAALAGHYALLSAAPYPLTRGIAETAAACGVHYLDLTEDVASTRRVKELAAGATTAFIPQCGLAPGFVSIVAADLARRFERLQSVRMRVGALPQFPSNALNYNLTWSTDGVINEYCEPCEAIVEGVRRSVPALEELEEFSLDGVTYEAFNTSGGLGTLCESLHGKVGNLNSASVICAGARPAGRWRVAGGRPGAAGGHRPRRLPRQPLRRHLSSNPGVMQKAARHRQNG